MADKKTTQRKSSQQKAAQKQWTGKQEEGQEKVVSDENLERPRESTARRPLENG